MGLKKITNLTCLTFVMTWLRWYDARKGSLPISSRQLEKANEDMLVRLLEVQAEGAVVCRISQVGTIGVAGRGQTDTFIISDQEILLICII